MAARPPFHRMLYRSEHVQISRSRLHTTVATRKGDMSDLRITWAGSGCVSVKQRVSADQAEPEAPYLSTVYFAHYTNPIGHQSWLQFQNAHSSGGNVVRIDDSSFTCHQSQFACCPDSLLVHSFAFQAFWLAAAMPLNLSLHRTLHCRVMDDFSATRDSVRGLQFLQYWALLSLWGPEDGPSCQQRHPPWKPFNP